MEGYRRSAEDLGPARSRRPPLVPILQAPVALQLLDQPPRSPLHQLQIALPEPRVGLVADAAQGAVEAPVGEHQWHRRVGAYVRLGCHPEVLGSVLALGVGDHVREAPVEDPLAVGLVDRKARAFSPAEGLGVSLYGPEDESVLGELRDEGDVHIEGLPDVAKHFLYGPGSPLAHCAPPPSSSLHLYPPPRPPQHATYRTLVRTSENALRAKLAREARSPGPFVPGVDVPQHTYDQHYEEVVMMPSESRS